MRIPKGLVLLGALAVGAGCGDSDGSPRGDSASAGGAPTCVAGDARCGQTPPCPVGADCGVGDGTGESAGTGGTAGAASGDDDGDGLMPGGQGAGGGAPAASGGGAAGGSGAADGEQGDASGAGENESDPASAPNDSGDDGPDGATDGMAGTATALSECRGVVAVRAGNGNYVGWRLKATDPEAIAFNVYRDETLLNPEPIRDSTNYLDEQAPAEAEYQVRPIVDGAEQGSTEVVVASPHPYIAIPLEPGNNQAGRMVGVGDLDGDCRYDFVVKRSDGDRDVTQEDGHPEETIKLEAYGGNGQFMWRRDVGPNIRPGVWFSPFVVFDLDGDGKAEIALKASEIPTSLGGAGDLNGDGETDYREPNGDVRWSAHQDVEYLEIWDGETGQFRARAPWIPVGPWGTDGYRYNRNMMSPAYLDGSQASVVITRGGNSRNEVHAYDYRDGELTQRWTWSVSNGGGNYGHNVRAADIDDDGRDEFLFFNVAIDDDGSRVLWNTMEAHGDRFHLSDIDPDRPGLEVFYIQEFGGTYTHPVSLRDARTGELIWGPTGDWGDVGRGLCANIDAEHRGMECWAVGSSPLYDAQGNDLGPRPNTPNMAIFWDADREREHISGTSISKWNGGSLQGQMSASGCAKGTRDCPMGYADILGDWREEAWWLCDGNAELRVYVSTEVTTSRMYTLMQDPEYRVGVGEMTQGYVQAPHTSFYIGSDMAPPPTPRLPIPPGT